MAKLTTKNQLLPSNSLRFSVLSVPQASTRCERSSINFGNFLDREAELFDEQDEAQTLDGVFCVQAESASTAISSWLQSLLLVEAVASTVSEVRLASSPICIVSAVA